ncbi:Prophage antirepressor [Kaistia soli DSM 19436]|uniref:Prophage antirepressor n=1 Tax=Kaistia soli DSM 19436 TaxID=1122133 RepID=A0A1M5IWI4_9HYPH|nr:BRO family protein [Kaistia soli]SHG32682.1 Prophage antirepressor [Kaistia soli DSM 19436]
MTELNLISKDFQGATVRAVNHPEHGELLMALDTLRAAGYDPKNNGSLPALNSLKVPTETRVHVPKSNLLVEQGSPFPNRGALFLTRAGVNFVLMASDKPKAQEFRQWLAGDVVNAIADTGGYLLNEAARDTAKADTRTSVPLPTEIAGTYAALIAEKKARIAGALFLLGD